jgi:predicted membrane protein
MKGRVDMKFIPFLLLLVMLLSMWLLPSATPALGIALVMISLALAFFSVLMKHRTAYREGRITRMLLLRNVFLDMFGILLAMTLAMLLAKYVAGIATQPIDNDLARLIASIIVGMLVGIAVGMSVNGVWGRFVKTSA